MVELKQQFFVQLLLLLNLHSASLSIDVLTIVANTLAISSIRSVDNELDFQLQEVQPLLEFQNP